MVIFARRCSLHTRASVVWILLEAGYQFAVGVDQRLFGFDFGDDICWVARVGGESSGRSE